MEPSVEKASYEPPLTSSSPRVGPPPWLVSRLMDPPSELGPSSEAVPLSSSTRRTCSSGRRSKLTWAASGSFTGTPSRNTETPWGRPTTGLA
jgi:hypothetical protein